MAVIRRLLYHASQVSLQQGTARMELEELLERIQSMIGPLGATITASDIARLNRITNCTSVIPEFDCTDYAVLKYRTYDGTCNNLFYPRFGAAEIAFPRLLPAEYENGIAAPVGQTQAMNGNHTSAPWPSARVISWKVVKNGPESETDPAVSSGITQMVMQWGQFLDHDIDLSPVFDIDCGGCNYTKKCSPIHVNMKDNTFGNDSSNEGECLSFTRSIPACLVDSTTSLARNQINQVTSFIDGSQVYGSSKEIALSLRSDVSGLLKQGGRAESLKGNLPFQKERPEGGLLPFFIAGDERANEQTGLTVMHTLWLREHNRIARKLAKINQCWGDEKLYQVSRKIVGALMQKITYSDFLPVLFGPYLTTYVPLYTKYNPFVDPSIPNSFAASAYRFGHSLIRNQLLRLGENYTAMDIGHLDLSRAFFNPVSYFESCGTDGLVRGLMVDSADPVDEFLNSVLTSKLFPKIPGGLGGDLASLNIQRGRDHGIPSYRRWQQFCEQIFPGHIVSLRDNKTEETLRWLYGEEGFREGMDLWVGGLAEERLPGAQIGPTFACILGLTFTKLRDGDRFWYEADYQFSTMQIRSLQQSSLGRVVCDNSDNIQRVSKDVFRSDSVRVSCDELPAIDLLLWRDYTCSRRHSHPHSHGG